jgi:vacuolar protein sorting-associated protein 13A/C
VSEKPSFTFTVDLEGIGVSLIDKRPQELVYLTMRGLRFGYADYPHYYDTFLDLKWIQIDNQLFGASFPIVLFPVQVPSDMKELEGHPTIQTSVAVLKDRCKSAVISVGWVVC